MKPFSFVLALLPRIAFTVVANRLAADAWPGARCSPSR